MRKLRIILPHCTLQVLDFLLTKYSILASNLTFTQTGSMFLKKKNEDDLESEFTKVGILKRGEEGG